MKKQLILLLMIFCFTVFIPLTVLCSESAHDLKLKFASGEWEPFTGRHLKDYGLFSKIVTDAFQISGIEIEYHFVPWKRGYEDTKYGLYDGTLGYIKSEERLKDFYFSSSIYRSDAVFFHLKGNEFKWNSYRDLQKFKIGATIGYSYGNDFDRAEKSGEIDVERIESDEQNFKKLLAGRIDIFPSNKETGTAILKQYFSPEERSRITYNSKVYDLADFYVIFPKNSINSVKFLKIFNENLKVMKDDGRYQKIISEYKKTAELQ